MLFEADSTQNAENVESAESFLSTVDFFIISTIIGIAVYWYFFRSGKKDDQADKPAFPKLTVSPARTLSYDPSFVNKMKNTGRNVVVFYGSQTGTGEEFANRLSKDCTRYHMKGMVADPEECDMEDLCALGDIENSLAIFCLATYGEGDPTDNAQEFFDWLQNDSDLSGLRFAVFGLGNKTYEHYNEMGKYVDRRLEELGGERVFELGMGDDDANIEEDFVTWRENFWLAVCERFGVQRDANDVLMRQYKLTEHDDLPKSKVFHGEIARLGAFQNQKGPYDAKNPFLSTVAVNRELHKGGGRSCMHIEFDITDSKVRYESGDHVAVFPMNETHLVEFIGKRLEVDLDAIFTLTNVDEEASKVNPFPCPCSYRTALSHYLDITSLPRTNVLRELSDYAQDPKDKEFLMNLTSTSEEGKQLYREWIVKDHRSITAVLNDISSLKPPIDHLCELLPRLHARYYSISSSPKAHPSSIHITAVLVDYKTRTDRAVKGVATSWLALKQPVNGLKPKVPIFIRKSQFRLPFKSSTPIIMIGPGTGLAPFRGFIQERDSQRREGKPLGDTILFFGCRKKAEDYLYQEELEQYLKDGTLTKLHVAFSRDQDKKVYVQHLLQQSGEEVWKSLENGGHIYVCGDARNMARDVHDSLTKIACDFGGLDSSKAEVYIKNLQTKGRYSCDVWS